MSDRVTIIRRGKYIDTVKTKDTDIDGLAEMMVGRKVNLVVEKHKAKVGDTILKIENLKALDHRGLPALRGVNLELRAGEILGIAGVDGNGQTELIETIVGLRKATEGNIIFKNESILGKSTKDITELGVGHIPEDRHKRGLVLKYSLLENSILGIHYRNPFAKGIMMNYENIRKHVNSLIKNFDVRTPNEDVSASALSGGNQQKLIVAREIEKDPDMIIAAQPTRGLDVGAIEYIHKRLIEERDRGRGVLLVSLELDEVMSLSDRIAVIYDGEIVDILDGKEVTEQKLGILMAGGTLHKDAEGGKKNE